MADLPPRKDDDGATGGSSQQLTMSDQHKVTKFLRELDNDQLIGVGVALGLHHPTLKRMKDPLGDMVAAWLREDNDVTKASGTPSWASLVAALKDNGHSGVVTKIIREGLMQATQKATPSEISSAFRRYGKYLKSYYSNNPVAHDDKLSIAPCSEFISLALVQEGEHDYEDDTSSQLGVIGGESDSEGDNSSKPEYDNSEDDISSQSGNIEDEFVKDLLQSTMHVNIMDAHEDPLELDDILTSGSKFVLIEGAPGIGKSTLAWELCRKWDALKSLQSYSIVLLLKLREGRVQNATSLTELFYHDDKALCENVASEVLEREGEGVLLILDGFDELPTSVVRDKESLIMRIVRGACIPRATRLVTSRPSVLYHKRCFPQGFRHIKIVGFTDENIEKFAEIAFKSEPKVLSKFKAFIFSSPVITSLVCIPVNCAILAQCYKEMRRSKRIPKTTTQLYTSLTLVLIRRRLIAIGKWDEDSKVPSSLNDLPQDVHGDLERVSKLAYSGLFEKKIKLVFTDDDVGKDFNHLGLLSEVKEMYVCEGARTSYSFLHLSLQEFLAAWHVSCHQELIRHTLAIVGVSRFHIFSRILAGFIGISDKNFGVWSASCDVALYACLCLFEAQSTRNVHIFSNFRGIYLPTPMDMYAFGYCLVNVPHQWQKVTVSSSIDMLVTSLTDHARGRKVSASICDLTLSLDGLDEPSSSKLKDLPHSLLKSIKKLWIVNDLSLALLEGMPVLRHLQEITLGEYLNFEEHCIPCFMDHNIDYLLKIISKCRNLKSLIVYAELTEVAVCGLAKAIASNSTIEIVKLKIYPLNGDKYARRMDSLAQAALSCLSLKTLCTNFLFHTSSDFTSPKSLSDIDVNLPLFKVTELPRLFDFLYNAAASVLYFRLKVYGDDNLRANLSLLPRNCVSGYFDCISLLNFCWPSMLKFNLPFYIPISQFHLDSLSCALRRDPGISQLKLRRSKSLSDLLQLKTLVEHAKEHCESSSTNLELISLSYAPVQRSQSCPDLVGIQSLHNSVAREVFLHVPRTKKDFPKASKCSLS